MTTKHNIKPLSINTLALFQLKQMYTSELTKLNLEIDIETSEWRLSLPTSSELQPNIEYYAYQVRKKPFTPFVNSINEPYHIVKDQGQVGCFYLLDPTDQNSKLSFNSRDEDGNVWRFCPISEAPTIL